MSELFEDELRQRNMLLAEQVTRLMKSNKMLMDALLELAHETDHHNIDDYYKWSTWRAQRAIEDASKGVRL